MKTPERVRYGLIRLIRASPKGVCPILHDYWLIRWKGGEAPGAPIRNWLTPKGQRDKGTKDLNNASLDPALPASHAVGLT